MTDPESGATYAVGVYYNADNGFGPSDATVRIYIRGTLALELLDRTLSSKEQFWYAATISWPSTQVFVVDQIRDGFPAN